MSLTALAGWRWQNADPQKCQALIELFHANHTAWVPTLVVMEKMIEQGGHDGTPMEADEKPLLHEAIAKAARLAVALHRMGGLVGLGTDFPIDGVEVGASVHREMELLVEKGGATPAEALHIATRSSATILDLSGIVGAVEANFIADLVVLAASPLERIGHTRMVEYVVHDGKLHKPGS